MQQYSVKLIIFFLAIPHCLWGLPKWLSGQEPTCQSRRHRRPEFNPWVRNGNSLQHSCLENPRDRGASWAAAQGVAKSRTQLITYALNCHCLWDLFPNQESNPSPWQWKYRVLTIGPPRNSPTLQKNWLLN